uniref:Uncharacterized protein n=1 Tax=Rhizophora mucronata TaxID=61149 RepID=A0A2P2JIF7_RHIMU
MQTRIVLATIIKTIRCFPNGISLTNSPCSFKHWLNALAYFI